MFGNIFKKKKILITGNSGFKGSWLTAWLLKLGANVVGISKDIPTKPSMFVELKLRNKIIYYQKNVKNLEIINKIVSSERPDFLFHFAAQPIVSNSYLNPIETIQSNTLGTANILESLRLSNHDCCAIIITSDKAYENVEQVWGYKENDRLGGKDVYSASKSAAEAIIRSYFNSFFKNNKNCKIKLAIGRAGNVIGGGDWADDRIVADCFRAWSKKKIVKIRSPKSTRPWQHVLEPLSGYLTLAENLQKNKIINGEAFNFGPDNEQHYTVQDLIKKLKESWVKSKKKQYINFRKNNTFYESKLLKLNCDKALYYLNWKPALNFNQTVKLTGDWYNNYYNKKINMYDFTLQQIINFEKIATNKNLKWTK